MTNNPIVVTDPKGPRTNLQVLDAAQIQSDSQILNSIMKRILIECKRELGIADREMVAGVRSIENRLILRIGLRVVSVEAVVEYCAIGSSFSNDEFGDQALTQSLRRTCVASANPSILKR